MNIGARVFKARVQGERHHCHETILRYVQKVPDDIRGEIDRNEFDELMATKKGICSRSRMDSIQSLHLCWRVGIFLQVVPSFYCVLPVGLSSFPNPPTSTTMVSS